jgi:hypothetical protein
MLGMIDNAMCNIAGSPQAWMTQRSELLSAGRWQEVLY